MDATGTLSGAPITYTTSPQDVCTANGLNGRRSPWSVSASAPSGRCSKPDRRRSSSRSPSSSPSTSPRAAHDHPRRQERVYGADDPPLTASYDGLVNGDTSADVVGLELTGPPSSAASATTTSPPPRLHTPTTTSSTPPARYEVTPAAADDHRRRQDPRLRRRRPRPTRRPFDGLVNGDDEGDFPASRSRRRPAGADVGTYDITVRRDPDYEITFVTGTEDVTPAPLTITADDKTQVYGADPGVHRVLRRPRQRRHRGRRQWPTVAGADPPAPASAATTIRVAARPAPTTRSTTAGTRRHPCTAHHHRRRHDQGVRREGPGVHRVVRRPGQRRHEADVTGLRLSPGRRAARVSASTPSRRPVRAT